MGEKSNRVVITLPGNELLAEKITVGLAAEKGNVQVHSFPDGETYLRLLSDVTGKDVYIVNTLNDPNDKTLPLFFLCSLLKSQNAKSICLIAPYLAYMRQDKIFNPGEALTSEFFAKLLCMHVDSLITIDPHLHRHHLMNEIYRIPCQVIHATEPITTWIHQHIPDALLIGPDSESEQWVSEVSIKTGKPYIILQKERHGDADVNITLPEIHRYKNYTPVLIDDIISTAHTMIETSRHLHEIGMKLPICVAVHAIFAGNAYLELQKVSQEIITCNTIQHFSNKIDVSDLIVEACMNQ